MKPEGTPKKLHLSNEEDIPDGMPTPSTIVEDEAEEVAALDEVPMLNAIRPEEINPGQGGWMAVSRTVRQIDEEKVKNCKEDIDTLLVFAGLYSAVLSAFLIESYRLLILDPQDEMVMLLRTIAAQNYTGTVSSVNSTTVVRDSVFDAPHWAIRVNVLWFASIVLSLSSASIGILVKGWLREYLAMPYTAPLDRLRAREYRRSALDKWRVLEIAAILPLLLQIALGLFFIGLCYFSAAVHDSIRYTTFPLVIGWACFFLLTTVAPLVSPRCPYKTTFLVDFLRYTRMTFRVLRALCGRNEMHPSHSLPIPSSQPDTAVQATFSRYLRSAALGALARLHAFIDHITRPTRNRAKGILRRIRAAAEPVQNRGEESASVEDIENIDTIFLNIDAQIPGNDLLGPILQLFDQEINNPTAEKATAFLIRMLGHRIGGHRTIALSSFVNLRALSVQDWLAMVNFIARNLERYQPCACEQWVTSSLLLLLSPANHPRPFAVSNVLAKYLYLIANDLDVSLVDRKACVLNYVLYYSSSYREPLAKAGTVLPRAQDVRRLVPATLHDHLTRTIAGILHSSFHTPFKSSIEGFEWQLDIIQFLLSFGDLHPGGGLPKTIAPTFHEKIVLKERDILMCLYDRSITNQDSPDRYLSRYTRHLSEKLADPSALVISARQLVDNIYGPNPRATLESVPRYETWVAFQNVLFEAFESSSLASPGASLKTWQRDLLRLIFLRPFPPSFQKSRILGLMCYPDALQVMLSAESATALPQSDEEMISVRLAKAVDADFCRMVRKCGDTPQPLFDGQSDDTEYWGRWGAFIETLAASRR